MGLGMRLRNDRNGSHSQNCAVLVCCATMVGNWWGLLCDHVFTSDYTKKTEESRLYTNRDRLAIAGTL